MNNRVLHVKDLHIKSTDGKEPVRGIDLDLLAGESLGLVGESGSGKTLTLRAVRGLLPTGMKETFAEKIVPPETAMIFQNPQSALDPLCGVVRLTAEVIACRQGLSEKESRQEALRLFARLRLPEDLAERDRYPWELSGGQQQRVVIACALACRPKLLLCDEPTTALDVTVQKETLDLIRSLQEEEGFSMLFVTHNLAVAAQMCGRLAVMADGRIVEEGSREEVLSSPRSEEAKKLLSAVLPVPKRRDGHA